MEHLETMKTMEHERRMEGEKRKEEIQEDKAKRREELEELRRKEDREYKLQDNSYLLTLGTYKSGRDLSLFLAKFEKVMADCKEPKNNWLTNLYPKLTEVLCARFDNLPDEQKNYDHVKIVLLQSLGKTVSRAD